MNTQSNTNSNTNNNTNSHPNRPGDTDLVVDNVKLALSSIGLAVFIGITLFGAKHSEQYFAMFALAVPVCFLWHLAKEKGGLANIPVVKMLTRFTTGFVVLFPVMVFLCMVWTGIVNLVFRFAIDKMHSEQARWDVAVLNFLLALVLAEESSKLALYFLLDRRDQVARPEYYIYFSSSTALGLVTAEVYFATYFMAPFLSEGDGQKKVEVGTVITLLIIFTGFLVPMQMLSSYYAGLAIARVQMLEKSVWSELPIPVGLCVLWRTLFLYSIFIILPKYFFAGVGLAIATMILFMWIVLRYQDNMPVVYLRSTGAMHIVG